MSEISGITNEALFEFGLPAGFKCLLCKGVQRNSYTACEWSRN